MTFPFPTPLRIATRKSHLALWQAHYVQAEIQKLGCPSELVLIETQGDRELIAFQQMTGQGFFTKAVQDAVLAGHADLAVHSLKDLPSAPFPGLSLAAIPCRASVHDLLLALPSAVDETSSPLPLRLGTIIGTSAIRRQDQLRLLRPDLQLRELRGNVPTRIEKLRQGEYQAILLAAAGIERLQLPLHDLRVFPLPPKTFLPAPGQGALALEVRSSDHPLHLFLRSHLHDAKAAATVLLERSIMALVAGGCQLALGVHATTDPATSAFDLSIFFRQTSFSLQGSDPTALVASAAEHLGLTTPDTHKAALRLLSEIGV